MQPLPLSVRPLQEIDIEPLSDYWFKASPEFLQGMGVDLAKMPARADWETMLQEQLSQSLEEKKSYCFIWQLAGEAVGHSNVNRIVFGSEAYMHLHLWRSDLRQKGLGVDFVRLTIPHFFQDLQLQKIYCEPYQLNPGPNKTLEKAGFHFVKTHITVPGFINFEQPVNLWEIERSAVLPA